uniref:Uncharacterized protein n=1 Tax=Denticeps clupeoides TaxID=299321 RepID=A0AAY4EV13_9TELE
MRPAPQPADRRFAAARTRAMGGEAGDEPRPRGRGRGGAAACLLLPAVLALPLGVLSCLATGPLHARCAVNWNISIPCFDVCSLLVNQIKEWTTETCPKKSQKCLYSLVSVSTSSVVATHTTPTMKFVDDITFTFHDAGIERCEIQGLSVPHSWYAILDFGTHYLNMYNLMKGSGLSSSPSFMEFTSDQMCTQFSSTRQQLDMFA